MLGFGNEGLAKFKANKTKKGTNLTKLRPFDVTEIDCNLVEPSITNHSSDPHKHEEKKILYSFFTDIAYQ